MNTRDFCRDVLGQAYDIKQDIKEQHYIELCNLITEIYNNSEYEHLHKLRICYSSTIFISSEWWDDQYGNILYEKDMDDGIPEEINVNSYYNLELNLKEKFNIINDLEYDSINYIHNKIRAMTSKDDREKIFNNKVNSIKHLNKVNEITKNYNNYEINDIDIVIRSCKNIL
tara:strand:- start:4619 stop:5131 length:513 start_codon:yes stop_codon:yes gene_type:complete